MKPKLSIIIPVYNSENFLEECINSILANNYLNFEIILVDDGSTDQSPEICDRFAASDSRIFVIHKPNQGQSSARNVGIDNSTGDYIVFIDSDDMIHPSFLNVLIDGITKSGSDIAACKLEILANETNEASFIPDLTERVFSKKESMKELFSNQIITFSPCNKIFKKSLLNRLRFNEGIIFEDMDLIYKLVHEANQVFYTGAVCYFYRYNTSSTTRKKFTLKRIDEYKVKQNMYNFYVSNYPDLADEVFGDLFVTGLIMHANLRRIHIDDLNSYSYLLSLSRKKMLNLVFNKNIKLKRKVVFAFAMISPELLSWVYSKFITQ